MSAGPRTPSEWNNFAKGTPFEGMGDTLHKAADTPKADELREKIDDIMADVYVKCRQNHSLTGVTRTHTRDVMNLINSEVRSVLERLEKQVTKGRINTYSLHTETQYVPLLSIREEMKRYE